MNDDVDRMELTPNRLPTVTVLRPRCPACGGIGLTKYRSIHDQGDTSGLAWVRCRNPACRTKFKILFE